MTRYLERTHLFRFGAPERRLRAIRDKLYQDSVDAGVPLSPSALQTAYENELDAACDATSAEADPYIGKVATLPLSSWTDALREKLAPIAAEKALAGVGFNPLGDNPDGALAMRAKESRRWLEMCAQGRLATEHVWTDATPDEADEDGLFFVTSDPPRRWSPYRPC